MKNNPIVPYILIMAFGIALIFFMSLVGVGEQEKAEGDTNGATTEVDGEALVQQACTSCHGGNLEGGVGPTLIGLDDEYIG